MAAKLQEDSYSRYSINLLYTCNGIWYYIEYISHTEKYEVDEPN